MRDCSTRQTNMRDRETIRTTRVSKSRQLRSTKFSCPLTGETFTLSFLSLCTVGTRIRLDEAASITRARGPRSFSRAHRASRS